MEGLVEPTSRHLESAAALVARGLEPSDRILVLGAGGWLGMTMLSLLHAVTPKVPVLAVASGRRDVQMDFGPIVIRSWNKNTVQRFGATVVTNFAFLTRERMTVDGLSKFAAANSQMIEHLLFSAGFASVRAALTISSGAALLDREDMYGRMKADEERRLLLMASRDKSIVVGRAYSLSGEYVRRPLDYAFSNFIHQSSTGQIHVTAKSPVWRRYVAADDFLAVCLRIALDGKTSLVESGGELIEMEALAKRIAAACTDPVSVIRDNDAQAPASYYTCEGDSWDLACGMLNYVPMTLDQQIRHVLNASHWPNSQLRRK